jgi:hypothetical protein
VPASDKPVRWCSCWRRQGLEAHGLPKDRYKGRVALTFWGLESPRIKTVPYRLA